MPLFSAFFGSVSPPPGVVNYGASCANITIFLANILRLAVIGASLFALFNILTAGFQYITSAGDPKVTGQIGNKLTVTIIGLVIVVGSFAIAGILGIVLFGDASAILKPTLFGVTTC